MASLHISSAAEQVASHLREQLIQKVWVETMPGGEGLARELGVGRMTIEAALTMLENEGLLVSQGPRRCRKIVLPDELMNPPRLRVAILLYEPSDQTLDYLIDCKNKLTAAGHIAFYAPCDLTEMKMDVERLARMVEKTEADAWVVLAGTRDVLEWFTQEEIPVFALFGWRLNLNIAGIGPDNLVSIVAATRRLIDLGHRRIIFLDSLFTISNPGIIGSAFLGELEARGIVAGSYNIPGWRGGTEGLYTCLDALFQHTPPTAIMVSSSNNYFATLHFLLNRQIQVPRDLSIVCIDDDPIFSQCRPLVSHTRWNRQPVVSRIAQWVNQLSQGQEDTRQSTIKTEFIEGGTIGAVPKG